MIVSSAPTPSPMIDTSGFPSGSAMGGTGDAHGSGGFDQLLSAKSQTAPVSPDGGQDAKGGDTLSKEIPSTAQSEQHRFIASMRARAANDSDDLQSQDDTASEVNAGLQPPGTQASTIPGVPIASEITEPGLPGEPAPGTVVSSTEQDAGTAPSWSVPSGSNDPAPPAFPKQPKFSDSGVSGKKPSDKAKYDVVDPSAIASAMMAPLFSQTTAPTPPSFDGVSSVPAAGVDQASGAGALASGSTATAFPAGFAAQGFHPSAFFQRAGSGVSAEQTTSAGIDETATAESAGASLQDSAGNIVSKNFQTAGNPDGALFSGHSGTLIPDAGMVVAKPAPAMPLPAQNSTPAQASAAPAGLPVSSVAASTAGGSAARIDSQWVASVAASQSHATVAPKAPPFSMGKKGTAVGDSKDFSTPTGASADSNSVASTVTANAVAGAPSSGFESSQNGGHGGASGNAAGGTNSAIEGVFSIQNTQPASEAAAKSSPVAAAEPAPLPAGVLAGLNGGLDRIQQHGDTRVDLRLPLEGGNHVDIQLRLQDGAVHASLITGSPELREALRQQWSQLASRGDAMGFRLAEPAFESAPQTGSGFAQQQSHGQQQQRTHSEDSAPTLPSPRPPLRNNPNRTTATPPTQSALTTWA